MRKSIRKIIAIASASVMALTFAVAYFGLQQTESWIFRDEWYQEENGLNGTNLPDGAYEGKL